MDAVYNLLSQVSHFREGIRRKEHYPPPHLQVPVPGRQTLGGRRSAHREGLKELAVCSGEAPCAVATSDDGVRGCGRVIGGGIVVAGGHGGVGSLQTIAEGATRLGGEAVGGGGNLGGREGGGGGRDARFK